MAEAVALGGTVGRRNRLTSSCHSDESICDTDCSQTASAFETVEGATTLNSSPHNSNTFDGEFDPQTLGDLSAEELLDALDREMQMIERFERRQKLGADALLDAVLLRREQPSETLEGAVEDFGRSAPRPTADYDLLLDLDRAIEQLNDTIQHLEQRSQNLERRESAYLEATATLLEVQERVAAQLEAVERQLADLRDTNNRSRRASA